ncbi:sigma factor-like helix-turn-helix DNA-binding protein [Trichocoleus sp. FACHB-262]|uniref:sigma factor-like helix-turn-helix DNA-binding protein n=1 Tax=Trichocoleus sp. FACHB-262 TaxID=2692869 RepID=UPI0018EF6824|nr:sigma factor-like helix-turn-helix DNA-binding protein [Trichocoleus sp. FACHB-262]
MRCTDANVQVLSSLSMHPSRSMVFVQWYGNELGTRFAFTQPRGSTRDGRVLSATATSPLRTSRRLSHSDRFIGEIENLPYEAIAQVTGVSLGTVKSRLVRARHRLQRV